MNSQKDSKSCFYNPGVVDGKRSLWQVLLWLLGYYKDPAACTPPPQDFYFPFLSDATKGAASLQFIGHSTFLLQFEGKALLTDPIFSERASPFGWIGPKRHLPPAITLSSLPKLDYILISHNHYDHLDLDTCLALAKDHPQVKFIVPIRLKSWFHKRNIRNVIELDWWHKLQEDSITITAVPSQHFSGRGLFDRNKTLWCGYVVQYGTKTCYFAGDTGYNELYFTEIGKRFKKIDLSIIPIGGYAPRGFMKAAHANPKEAIQIHKDVGSKLAIGCHWGTFRLSDEPLNRPPYDLWLADRDETFCLLKHGGTVFW